jgi:hypothetical protein
MSGGAPPTPLSVTDLPAADLQSEGPTQAVALNHPAADLYVSADPLAALRGTGVADASFGIQPVTHDDLQPRGFSVSCTPLLVGLPGGGVIDMGVDVCSWTFTEVGGLGVFTRIVIRQ